MDDEFGFADAFAGGLDEATWAEGGFEDEDGVATAGFRFEEFSRRVAADLFVGGPEEDEALLKRRLRLLQRFQGEKRLDDASLHVENSGTVGFAGGNAKRHFGERAGGIHSVVVTENEELSGGAGFVRPPGNAQMVAAMLLRNALDACAAIAPGGGDDFAATIGGGFFKAGRFGRDKLSKGGEHLRQAGLQAPQEILWETRLWHGGDMLTMGRGEGNGAENASL